MHFNRTLKGAAAQVENNLLFLPGAAAYRINPIAVIQFSPLYKIPEVRLPELLLLFFSDVFDTSVLSFMAFPTPAVVSSH